MLDTLLSAGIDALREYLALHVLLCLIPAFFLAGAIASLFSKESVLKYFGADSPKYITYPVAAISGVMLAVCSCTVLPLFAGIYKRGAGIGPATTFLYSAPAINLLAIVYTAKILGFDIGVARAVAAIGLSVVIGLTMSVVFQNHNKMPGFKTNGDDRNIRTTIIFILLLAILVFAGIAATMLEKAAVILLVLITIALSWLWYTREELKNWMQETWFLVKQITPLLFAGVFLAGVIVAVLPGEFVATLVGGNSISANLISSVSGSLMYFSTLTEVPIISALTKLGMGKGPALTMLLAGPALSLPNMIVISRIMGTKRTGLYIALVIFAALVSGIIFGNMVA
ncbi:MAG: permease [ANME-2 cluster archaeon]|nr:permease [ANME-2 cluster archaeon]MBC2700157.1 permease [ANME-2 cluster archaeon]MBC2706691.1 permease [ANME-2 cluster archaeon]MBC2745635.1 permease [ANME-2 cluster archaeon]MBC2762823.1 permease [ANME-2 cluster archaeon]